MDKIGKIIKFNRRGRKYHLILTKDEISNQLINSQLVIDKRYSNDTETDRDEGFSEVPFEFILVKRECVSGVIKVYDR